MAGLAGFGQAFQSLEMTLLNDNTIVYFWAGTIGVTSQSLYKAEKCLNLSICETMISNAHGYIGNAVYFMFFLLTDCTVDLCIVFPQIISNKLSAAETSKEVKRLSSVIFVSLWIYLSALFEQR